MGISDAIKSVLNKFSIDIVRYQPAVKFSGLSSLIPKYKRSLQEIAGVYRQYALQSLPELDEIRIGLLLELNGGPSAALYIMNYINLAISLSGDVIEFGVGNGATSALIAHEISGSDKVLWLFDTFSGLPAPSSRDSLKDDIFSLGSMAAYQGTMAYNARHVQRRLKDLHFPEERRRIVAGLVANSIQSGKTPQSVCFAYVDFDFYEPIRDSLAYLDGVLVPGGYIIVDDYDFFSIGAKDAVDEFVATTAGRYQFSKPLASAGQFCILQRGA